MQVEGRNPIREALRAGAAVKRLRIAEGTDDRGALAEILELAAMRNLRVERVERRMLDSIAETEVHQGVIAEIPFSPIPWQHAVERARERGEVPLVLALDGITDPHNAGSLIRSAHVFGAHAVLLPSRRSVSVTPAVAKSSSGAIWHIAVDDVGNLDRAIADCKQDGLWVAALHAGVDTEVSNCPLLGEPLVLVVGAEGDGVSHLLRERADVIVGIAQSGRIDSLNASVAGAIALYAAHKARSVS